ncbi:MAG: hypothetical protein P4M00_15915 [Azospirillaceae bacterium]|nr:hypothetical protein [Azospirillaceae bacterium]
MDPSPSNTASPSLVDRLNAGSDVLSPDGKWALAMARLIESRHKGADDGTWTLPFDQFRAALDVPSGVYETWSDFERCILQDARDGFAAHGVSLIWQVATAPDQRQAALTLSWATVSGDSDEPRTASPLADTAGAAPVAEVEAGDDAGDAVSGDNTLSRGIERVTSNPENDSLQPSRSAVATSLSLQPTVSLGEVQTQVAHLEGQLLLTQQEAAVVRSQRDQAARELAKCDTVYRIQLQLLQNQVAQFQGEAVQLRERLAETQSRLEATRTQSEEVLSVERRNALARLADAQLALDESRGRQAELESQLDQGREQVRQAFVEIDNQLQGDRKRHHGEVTRLTEDITNLTIELEQAQRLVSFHSAEVEDLRQQVERERAESAVLLSEERAAYARLLEEEKAAAKVMTDAVRADAAKAVAQAESALATALARNEDLERRLRDSDNVNEARLRSQKAAGELDQRRLMAEISRLRTDLDFHKRRVAALSTGPGSDHDGNAAESERALAEANERVAALTSRLAGAEAERDQAKAREAQFAAAIEDLRRQVQELSQQSVTRIAAAPAVQTAEPPFVEAPVVEAPVVEAPVVEAPVVKVAAAPPVAEAEVAPPVVAEPVFVEVPPVFVAPQPEPAPVPVAPVAPGAEVGEKPSTARQPDPASPVPGGTDTRLSALSQNFFTLTGRLRP